ncbi:MAG: hypothetical protein AAFV26_07205 [Pseudomonadota bacterium]
MSDTAATQNLTGRRQAPRRSALAIALALNVVWINASEVFRYFAFVMPMMREALPQVPDVAPMSLIVFAIWGLWDTIVLLTITLATWVYLDRTGTSYRGALISGTAVWLAVFVVLWLGPFNMNLAPAAVVLTALPLAWLEMVVAAGLVAWARRRAGL